MPECLNCGEWVSDRFARVMGDNDDNVKACGNCVSKHEINDRAAKGADHEESRVGHWGRAGFNSSTRRI